MRKWIQKTAWAKKIHNFVGPSCGSSQCQVCCYAALLAIARRIEQKRFFLGRAAAIQRGIAVGKAPEAGDDGWPEEYPQQDPHATDEIPELDETPPEDKPADPEHKPDKPA